MKAIVIDDNTDFIKAFLQGHLFDECFTDLFVKNRSPREIANEINDTLLSYKITREANIREELIIFINIDIKISKNQNRHGQKGAEILIWLRCKHMLSNPVILYSFRSNFQLIKSKPEHLILNSIGCYYYQLPFDFKKIREENFKGIKDDQWLLLKNYLKSAVDIESLRHQYANIWGIKQLWDVHRIYQFKKFSFEYPEKIKQLVKTIDYWILNFSFGLGNDNLEKKINEKRIAIKNRIDQTVTTLNKILIKIQDKELEINENRELIELFSAELQKICIKIKKHLLSHYIDPYLNIEKQKLEIGIRSLNNKIELINNILSSEEKQKEQEENAVDDMKSNFDKMLFDSVKMESKNLLNTISNKDVRILQIDDQATDGWAFIFDKIIFQNDSSNFKTLEFDSTFNVTDQIEDKITALLDLIKTEIDNTTLILLDLRIFPIYDSKSGLDVQNISGIKLLKKLKEQFPEIPVLITTASNKAWSLKEVIKFGADAYWVKEGIDDAYNCENSINNYHDFISLICKFSNSNFDTLRKFGRNLKKLKIEKELWWKNEIDWVNLGGSENNLQKQYIPKKTIPDSDQILSILEDCFILFREHLQRTILKSTFNPFKGNREWVLPSLIVQHAAKIIELIHDFKNSELCVTNRRFKNKGLIDSFTVNESGKLEYCEYDYYMQSYKNKPVTCIPCRMDKTGGQLFENRNIVSHTNNVDLFGYPKLNKFLIDLVKYLSHYNKSSIKFTTIENN